MKQLYGMQEHDEVNPRDFVEIGFYYDEKSKKFFWSKDLFHLKYGQQEGVAQDSQKE